MPEIFKTDSKGKIRVWWCEVDGDQIRNVSGIYGGKLVESGWKKMKEKNVGRSNQTSVEEQAKLETQALYDKQLAQGGYKPTIEQADEKTYIEPMLAQKYADITLDFNQAMFSQPKLDGHRCIATKDGLFTRKGKKYVSVPHIHLALFEVFQKNPALILDGELYNHDLHDDFNKISSLVRKTKPDVSDLEETEKLVQYHIYDIVDPQKKTIDRQQDLFDIFEEFKLEDSIVRVDTTYVSDQEELDNLYAKYISQGYEGQMVRYNTRYEMKRTGNLIKRKEFFDEEGLILDIIEGEGNWAGMAKSLLVQLKDGVIASSGIRGNQAFATELLVNKHLYLGNGSEATIRYPNKTPAGKPRFPVATAIYRGGRDS